MRELSRICIEDHFLGKKLERIMNSEVAIKLGQKDDNSIVKFELHPDILA